MDSNEFEGTARDLKGHVKDAVGGLTGDTQTQAQGKFDQAAGTVQKKYGQAADAVSDAASSASDTASDYASRARATLHDATDTMRAQASDIGGKVYDAGAQAGQYVGDTVKEQPLLSLIGVAAIGYLIGFLVHSAASPFAPPAPQPVYRRIGWR